MTFLSSFVRRASKAFALTALAALGTACIIEHDHDGPGRTEIEFDEVRNLGYYCGGPLTSWTVSNRETGDQGTAGCEQPVLFTDLAPFASYTFDITGQSGSRTCWAGSCSVSTGRSGSVSLADCSGQIDHLCGI